MNNTKKRGQITVFIVIGIILLIAVGLFITFRFLLMPEPTITVPEEVAPVKEFIDICLEQTLTDAVVLAGIQGGYTTLPDDLRQSPYGHLPVAGEFKTPMWYYSGSTRIPEIFEIEDSLNSYIEQNLDLCLQNFTGIEAYNVESTIEAQVLTTINKEDVRANMFMPITIVKGEERFEWEEYSVKVDAKLLKAYETAVQVLENENKNMFLESVTVDMMAIDPDFPLTDFRFDTCHRLTWTKQQLTTRLKDTMYYNLPRLRSNLTKYDGFAADEEFQKLHFVVPALTQKVDDVTVSFRYDKDWPMFLDARPSDGSVLKSNSGKGFAKYLAFLCMNLYHFTYDIDYPVEVAVREDTSFNGQGLVFRFGTPVIIRQNQGQRSSLGRDNLLVPQFEPDFCSRLGDDVYDIRVIDPATNEEIDANVSFECLVFRCDIGRTELTSDDLAVSLKTRLPDSCTGGNLIVNAEYDEDFNLGLDETEYHISFDEINTLQPINIPAKPYKLVEVEVSKYRVGDLGTPLDIEQNEEVLIQLDNDTYSEFITWTFDGENDKLRILLEEEVTYDVTLMLTKDERYVGGYSGQLKLSYSDAADHDIIEFPVIANEAVVTDEELVGLITYIEEKSYAAVLAPELK